MSSDKCKAGAQSLDPKLLAACGMDPKNPKLDPRIATALGLDPGNPKFDPMVLVSYGLDPNNPNSSLKLVADFIKYGWKTQKSATSTAIPISSSTGELDPRLLGPDQIDHNTLGMDPKSAASSSSSASTATSMNEPKMPQMAGINPKMALVKSTRITTEVEDNEEIHIDDYDLEDEIEDQLEKEEQEIIECFRHDFNEFMKEVRNGVKSANLQTQTQEASNDEEFIFEETRNTISCTSSQEKVAEDFFKNKILKSFPKEYWKRFKYFDTYIIVPKFLSLGEN